MRKALIWFFSIIICGTWFVMDVGVYLKQRKNKVLIQEMITEREFAHDVAEIETAINGISEATDRVKKQKVLGFIDQFLRSESIRNKIRYEVDRSTTAGLMFRGWIIILVEEKNAGGKIVHTRGLIFTTEINKNNVFICEGIFYTPAEICLPLMMDLDAYMEKYGILSVDEIKKAIIEDIKTSKE